MNHHIKGIVEDKYPGYAVIDNNGAGYMLHISMETYDSLPEKGGRVTMYTYISIRNEMIELFGFSTMRERKDFLELISVPKIGPKTAIAVFNTLSPEVFEEAVMNSDAATLSRVKGISRKTAEKIILEMSGKLEMDREGLSSDAYNALIVLGFSDKEIRPVISEVQKENKDADAEAIIREALKRLG